MNFKTHVPQRNPGNIKLETTEKILKNTEHMVARNVTTRICITASLFKSYAYHLTKPAISEEPQNVIAKEKLIASVPASHQDG